MISTTVFFGGMKNRRCVICLKSDLLSIMMLTGPQNFQKKNHIFYPLGFPQVTPGGTQDDK